MTTERERWFLIAVLLSAWISTAGCLKPYHFNEDWWEEKVERRDDDWGKRITP